MNILEAIERIPHEKGCFVNSLRGQTLNFAAGMDTARMGKWVESRCNCSRKEAVEKLRELVEICRKLGDEPISLKELQRIREILDEPGR